MRTTKWIVGLGHGQWGPPTVHQLWTQTKGNCLREGLYLKAKFSVQRSSTSKLRLVVRCPQVSHLCLLRIYSAEQQLHACTSLRQRVPAVPWSTLAVRCVTYPCIPFPQRVCCMCVLRPLSSPTTSAQKETSTKDTATTHKRHDAEATRRQHAGREPTKEKTAFCRRGLDGGCQERRHDCRAGGP